MSDASKIVCRVWGMSVRASVRSFWGDRFRVKRGRHSGFRVSGLGAGSFLIPCLHG